MVYSRWMRYDPTTTHTAGFKAGLMGNPQSHRLDARLSRSREILIH